MKHYAPSTILPAVAAGVLFFILTAGAEPATAVATNFYSAETQGRLLAEKILQQTPPQNYSNSAVLRVRASQGGWISHGVTSRAIIANGHWKNIFSSDALKPTNEIFTVTHTVGQPNTYTHEAVFSASGKMLPSSKTTPFACSDFWLGDLGLDFFHWPEQRILKKEFHRNCACTVLESVNSGSEKNAYSRIVSWIDNDSLGIVEAYGYDGAGKLLKEFTPKSFKKVNGRWEIKEIEIRNVQTGSRTRLEFDLK